MIRSRKQIDDDARSAAQAVRAAGRPLCISELGDALRKLGRRQTDKQARITAERALELGLLRRRGSRLWDEPATPGPQIALTASAVTVVPTPLFMVQSVRRLLELSPSAGTNRAARHLLDLAAAALDREGQSEPPGPGAPFRREGTTRGCDEGERATAAPKGRPQVSNGAMQHDDPDLEVLLANLTG